MIIGRIQQNEICDGMIQNAVCPNCNNYFHAPMMRSQQTGSIFFIPFIKATVGYYTMCPHCKMTYRMSSADYKAIIHSPNAVNDLYRISQNNLVKQYEKLNRFQYRSNKKVGVAAVSALIGGLFGLQNWYMGHKKRAGIALGIFGLGLLAFAIFIGSASQSFAILPTIFLAFNMYWGLFDTVRILSGYAKDSNGCYIMTNRQYQKRIQQLNGYYR